MTGRKSPAKKTVAKKASAKKATAKKTTARKRPTREDQVLKARREGATFAAIAKRLRFRDAAAAHTAYERALAPTLPESPERLKRATLEKVREAEAQLWPTAEGGDLAAIARLVSLDIERQAANRDQLVLRSGSIGPIERATLQEIKRLHEVAPALASTAQVLAKIVDDNREPGPTATAARELRMHMSQLRGLAGTNPKFNQPPQPPPEEDQAGAKGGGRVVVPETELDRLRRRAAERAQGS